VHATVEAIPASKSWTTVDVRVVINIGDVDIRDARVRDVHAIKIATAHAIPRHKWLTESQRAPAVAAESAAKANTHSPSRPAEPRD
jgi:hypothetical protein